MSGLLIFLVVLIALIFIIASTSSRLLHPFLALLLASFGIGLVNMGSVTELIETITTGFGSILGKIGIIVILGSVLGVVLEKTGAINQIAFLILRLFGEKRPGIAMTLIGGIVSIPVFCDSGFILLSPLSKEISRETKRKRNILSLSLASGLYTTHTLIPPTPGPLAAAESFDIANYLGLIMIMGFVISIPVLLVSNLASSYFGNRISFVKMEELKTKMNNTDLPSSLLSILPLLTPVLLISMGSVVHLTELEPGLYSLLVFFSNPIVALFIGLGLTIFLVRKKDKGEFTNWTGEGIKQAGPILIITAAGGAFGTVLSTLPIAETLKDLTGGIQMSGLIIMITGFMIAAILKTSQGSSTSAIIIASSIMAPIMVVLGAPVFDLVLMVMAIGGGSMVVSHANDSYFWVVSQFSEISMRDAYKSFSIITLLQGVTVLVSVILIYLVYNLL